MNLAKIEEEIAALTKQGQEAVLLVHKIEGALQFAHHMRDLLKQTSSEAEAPVIEQGPVVEVK